MRLAKHQWAFAVTIAGLLAVGCGNSGSSSGNTSTDDQKPSNGGTTSADSRPMPTAEGNKVEGDTIKLGLVASENGANRPWGIDSVAGAKLAVDEANQKDLFNGKKIELVIGDSNSDSEQGKSAAERLISQDKVVALLGEVASGITLQMADVAFRAGVPLVSVGATKTELTDKGANLFRVCYTDAFQGPVMAKFAYDQLGLRNVALVTDQKQPYSKGLSDSFRIYFTGLGGKIADEQFYESGTVDFKGILTNLKAKNPDGLFMSGYFPETGPIARQAADAGIKVPMMGGDGWDSSEILQTGGEAIIGSYFCNHYNNSEKRPEVQEFLTKWKAKYGGIPGTTMGALGYDAAAVTIDALKRAKSLDSKSLTDALEETENFQGVTGAITLKGMKGNPPKRALVVQLQAKSPAIPNDNGQKFVKAYDPNDLKDDLAKP